jgi:hypothetical protein
MLSAGTTGDWMMLIGLLGTLSAASAITYRWVLGEPPQVPVEEGWSELQTAA